MERVRKMDLNHKIFIAIALIIVTTLFIQPCSAQRQNPQEKKDIWTEDGPEGPRWRHGRRPPELTEDIIEQIMKNLQENNPAKARELAELRKNNPEKFEAELRRYGREEFGRIIRERIESRRRKQHDEYIQWLEKNYPEEAEKLSRIREKDPEIYIEQFGHSLRQYGRIFEASKENPELAEVLKEDLELKKKRDELLRKIIATDNEQKKKELTSRLEEIVNNRFDLIVRRKQIAYEQLLKKLEQLQKQIKESRDEIAKWRNEQFKIENVKRRVNDLIGETHEFKWD